jgi:plasmid stabilization system protein ParE
MKKSTTPYTIEMLDAAADELDSSLDYVATNRGEAAAKALAKKLFDAIDSIAQTPSTGRPGRVGGTRELVVSGTSYLIPFRVKGTTVQILRIFHTSRQLPQYW